MEVLGGTPVDPAVAGSLCDEAEQRRAGSLKGEASRSSKLAGAASAPEASDGLLPGDAVVAPLVPDAVELFGWRVQAHGTVASTNALVKDALRDGCAEGVCITALRQTGGYGRQGRAWESPVGGLYTSFALRPVCDPSALPTLGLAVSLAVARALERASRIVGVRVKWPNDVLCDAGKLAGISCEAVGGDVCIGVGINAFCPAHECAVPGKYRVAHLFDERVGDDLSASQRAVMTGVLEALLEELAREYARWREGGFAACRNEYSARLAYVGSPATLETIDGSPLTAGIIRGVDEGGCLVVEAADGSMVHAASGEVHVSAVG